MVDKEGRDYRNNQDYFIGIQVTLYTMIFVINQPVIYMGTYVIDLRQHGCPLQYQHDTKSPSKGVGVHALLKCHRPDVLEGSSVSTLGCHGHVKVNTTCITSLMRPLAEFNIFSSEPLTHRQGYHGGGL